MQQHRITVIPYLTMMQTQILEIQRLMMLMPYQNKLMTMPTLPIHRLPIMTRTRILEILHLIMITTLIRRRPILAILTHARVLQIQLKNAPFSAARLTNANATPVIIGTEVYVELLRHKLLPAQV